MRRLLLVLESLHNSGAPALTIDLRASEGFAPSWTLVNMLLPMLPPRLTSLALAVDLDKSPKELFRGRASLTTLDLSGSGGLQAGLFGSAFRDSEHLLASMRSLTTLMFTHCPDLDVLPSKLADLPRLTTLDVSHCPRLCHQTRYPQNLYQPYRP